MKKHAKIKLLSAVAIATGSLSINTYAIDYIVPQSSDLTMYSQEPTNIKFSGSSEPVLIRNGFNDAVITARKLVFGPKNYPYLSKKGLFNENDTRCYNYPSAVGYFASLSGRCAYYARDFYHMAEGAYYLGLDKENLAMHTNFASVYVSHKNEFSHKNYSFPKWAYSYDGSVYEQRNELPAYFEQGISVIDLYKKTGDSRYLGSNFQNLVKNLYSYMNDPLNRRDGFRLATPGGDSKIEDASYNEFLPKGVGVVVLGADAAAMQTRYLNDLVNTPFLKLIDSINQDAVIDDAQTLKYNFNNNWWAGDRMYSALYLPENSRRVYHDGKYWEYAAGLSTDITYYDEYLREPDYIPLSYGLITDVQRAKKQAIYIDSNADTLAYYNVESGQFTKNIEGDTYLPRALYKGNENDRAAKWMYRFANELLKTDFIYPEVPYVFISDVINSVMGYDFTAVPITSMAAQTDTTVVGTIKTLPKLESNFVNGDYYRVVNIPVKRYMPNSAVTDFNVKVGLTHKVLSGRKYESTLEFNSNPKANNNRFIQWLPKYQESIGGERKCKITYYYINGDEKVDSNTKLEFNFNDRTYECKTANGELISLGLGNDNAKYYKVSVTTM
jgi:hypothetical protein